QRARPDRGQQGGGQPASAAAVDQQARPCAQPQKDGGIGQRGEDEHRTRPPDDGQSAPGWIRTSNPRLRRPVLYPVELQGPHPSLRLAPSARSQPWHGWAAGTSADPVQYLDGVDASAVKRSLMSTIEGDDEQDLTRKQRREQARAKRRELEQAEAASALRRTRLTQLGIVAVIVVAIVVGIVVATGGGSKKGIATNPIERNATVGEVSSLLGGIPESGNNALGSPTAPVTLQYFA